MKQVAAILLMSFAALSLFGFIGMLETPLDTHAAQTCLASLAQNGACPPEENTVASAIFHTNAYKVFSTAFLSLAALLLALSALIVLFILPLFLLLGLGLQTIAESIRTLIIHYYALARLRLALARFELSPTIL